MKNFFRKITVLAAICAAFTLNTFAQGRTRNTGSTPPADTIKAPAAKGTPAAVASAARIAELEKQLGEAQQEVKDRKAELEAIDLAALKGQMSKLATDKDVAIANLDARTTERDAARQNFDQVAKQNVRLFDGRRMFFRASLVALFAAIVFAIVAFGKKLGMRRAGIIVGALFGGLIILLANPEIAGAATPKFVCGDPTFNANFFPNDGKEYEVICVGIVGKKIEFSDPAVVISDPAKAIPGTVFKATVGTTVAVGHPEMKVDGKVVESTFEVVDTVEFDRRDATVTSILQVIRKAGIGGGGSGDSAARLVLEGMACPSQDAACLANFRKAAWGPTKGSSAEVGAAIHTGIVEEVFADRRIDALKNAVMSNTDAVAAMKAAFDEHAAEPQVTPADLAPIARTANAAQAKAEAAQATADRAVRYEQNTAPVLQGLADAAAAGKKPQKETARLWAINLKCFLEEVDGRTQCVPETAPAPASKPAKKAEKKK